MKSESGSAAPSFIWCETVKARASPSTPTRRRGKSRSRTSSASTTATSWLSSTPTASHGPDHLAFERQDQEAHGRPAASAEAGEIVKIRGVHEQQEVEATLPHDL